MNSKKMKMITLPLIALLSVAMIWEQSFIAAIFSAAAGILLLLTTAKFYKISRKKRMYKSYFYIYLYFPSCWLYSPCGYCWRSLICWQIVGRLLSMFFSPVLVWRICHCLEQRKNYRCAEEINLSRLKLRNNVRGLFLI